MTIQFPGKQSALTELIIGIKGGGDLATGIALVLFKAGMRRLFIMEVPRPTVVRRAVAFASALYQDSITVEGVSAVRTDRPDRIPDTWSQGQVPVCPDPDWHTLKALPPQVLVDAVVAKQNLGTAISHAPLVIGLGPGFTAGTDVHRVIETQRGHHLGRIIDRGSAAANTSRPEAVMGITGDRVVRAPAPGTFKGLAAIGDQVLQDQVIGKVDGVQVTAKISGVVRGLIHDGVRVRQGRKIGDIDPRGDTLFCTTVSDKARSVGGAVLGAILGWYNR